MSQAQIKSQQPMSPRTFMTVIVRTGELASWDRRGEHLLKRERSLQLAATQTWPTSVKSLTVTSASHWTEQPRLTLQLRGDQCQILRSRCASQRQDRERTDSECRIACRCS